MNWFLLFLVAGAALAAGRIWFQVRKLRQQRDDDWDARLVERLRRSGIDPFKPMELDFFLAMPSETLASEAAEELSREGFVVDVKPVPDSTDHPFSVHAMKTMNLSTAGVREVSTRLKGIAQARGGRYDGWAPGRSPAA
jgi:hypothetical protein